MDKWIEGIVGKMHVHKIKQSDVAEKLGCTTTYVNLILNGNRKAKNMKDKVINAVDELISEQSG